MIVNVTLSFEERIPEHILINFATQFIRLYDGEFICSHCRQSCKKTQMYCRNCGYKASMMERLRESEQNKYNKMFNDMR